MLQNLKKRIFEKRKSILNMLIIYFWYSTKLYYIYYTNPEYPNQRELGCNWNRLGSQEWIRPAVCDMINLE